MNAKDFLVTYGSTAPTWNPNDIAALAQGYGYRFTPEEPETAADELWGNLSEDQLRDIAGGGGSGNPNPGPVTVDLSVAGKSSGSGTWTPPPGDVSGNSCFFTKR